MDLMGLTSRATKRRSTRWRSSRDHGKIGLSAVACGANISPAASRSASMRGRLRNTYLLWLRFQRMRGAHSDAQHAQECAQLRDWIGTQQTPPWREFLNRWQSA